MKEINFKQLEAFVAVVQNKNFSASAKELYLSQSTISTHISNLEKCLNCRLFERKAGCNPVLTPSGQKVYDEAIIILQHCAALSKIEDDETQLKLGASTVPSKYLLPSLMTDFHTMYPQCKYKLYNGNSGQIHSYLEAGKINIGFVGEKIDEKKFSYQFLARDRFVLITANTKTYCDFAKQGFTGNMLLNKPFLIREKSSGTRQFFEEYLKAHGNNIERLNIVGEFDDTEAIKFSVIQDMGVAVISALSVSAELKDGKLLGFDLDTDGAYRNIYIVKRKIHTLSQVEEKFVKFASENIEQNNNILLSE